MSRKRKFAAAATAVTSAAVLGVFAWSQPASAQVITTCPATISSFTFAGGAGGGAVGQGLHTLRETATACNYTATTYITFGAGGSTTTRNVRVTIIKNFVYPVHT